jgi:ABC-type lipoprotein release transport system permease subunit
VPVSTADRVRGLREAFAQARRELAPRRRHALLSALGIALAAAMLSAAIVVADGLGYGFARSARAADLPDLIIRFDAEPQSEVDQRIRALPDVAGYATRTEFTNTSIAAPGGHSTGDAVAELVGSSRRRGYAVVAGHDLAPTGNQILVEKAFADSWGLKPGSIAYLRGLGPERVVGLVEAPDNVGFPLAKPRYYLARSALAARFGRRADPKVNYAEVWLRNRRYLNETLVQARASSFGLRGLQFATRSGVRILHDQAAGIVIDLLVALSLIALVTAGAMLAASARAEVQRRLRTIGVQRAVGASSGQVTLVYALQATLVAAPAAAVGCLVGGLAVAGPSDRLLTLLNEPAPGAALIVPLLAGWAAAVLVAVGGAAWPAWRAASGPVAVLLRGADVTGGRGRLAGRRLARLRSRLGAGPAVLGARLVLARRARLLATVATLGLSAAFVLLMLSLASELSALQADPGVLGERYQLTASLPPTDAARVRRIPGVQAAAPRYDVQAVDSFSLGETIDVIAYPGSHTTFEAPPLSTGRRLRGEHQAEIGEGLAEALGLSPGQTLALELPTGNELRLRVSGVVNSLDHDGRVAYVPGAALLGADPGAGSVLAVRLDPGADANRVAKALGALGGAATTASGATARGASLVSVLRAIVTAVAIVDGLVCLYALLQACALTVQERRRALAVLRACGAGAGAVRRLLAGAALCLLVPSTIVGVLLERLVLGPALSRLAENYVTLPLQASGEEVALTAAGLLLAGAAAVLWVARQAGRQSVIRELSA